MNILISGASGFLGSALVTALREQGHTVLALTRAQDTQTHETHWEPSTLTFDSTSLPTIDIVINLAGEPIASGRWNAAKKERIKNSRINSTTLLATFCAEQTPAPKLFLSASAIGFYGSRADTILTEEASSGTGFLAETCRAWEQASKDARVPTAQLRFGVILNPRGGALQKMLPAFSLGLGGPLGDGNQWMSWITLGDAVAAMLHCIEKKIEGPVNVTAPHPVTNNAFTKALGAALHRPTVARVPAFVLKLLLGEMAEEMLLASARVSPRELLNSGFEFSQPRIEAALSQIIQE